jgi:RHS repeat-associated protein
MRSFTISMALVAVFVVSPLLADDYLVVLNGHPPGLPDAEITRLGGAVKSRLVDRVEVELSAEAAEELRQNASVAYLQRVGPAGSEERPGRGTGGRHNAAPDFVPTSPNPWSSGDYTYDGAGNISAIGTSAAPASDGSTNAYLYDSNSRLTNWTLGGTSARTEVYDYDPYANMKSITINGATTSIGIETATNRLTSHAYDVAGNLNDPYTDQQVSYDALNMMTTSTINGSTTKYVYTPDDERIGVGRGDTWTWSIRGADHQVLRQYSSSESSNSTAWLWLEDYVYRDGQLLAAVRPPELGGRRHFHLDHLGTPRLITADDGSQISQHDYSPWGVEITATCQETNHGYDREELRVFTGQERDFRVACSDTQVLDYMHARYFNPNVGRFVSVDPAVGDPHAPATWNRYAYAADNPINRVDPDGRNWFLIGGTWYWHAGNTYTYKVNGKSVTFTSPYTHLMVAQAVGRNVAGGVTFRITLYNQNRVVHTGFGFSGGVNTGSRIAAGNYKIRTDIRDAHGPNIVNPNSPDHNPPQFYGTQVMRNEPLPDPVTGERYLSYQAYGAMRARLNPMDPGMKDVGDYFHGQEEGYYLPGQTHGCLSYGRDYEFINYMWNLPPQQIPVAVDVPVVP